MRGLQKQAGQPARWASARKAGNAALAAFILGEAGRVLLLSEGLGLPSAGAALAALLAAWFVLVRPAPTARDTGWGALFAIAAAVWPFVLTLLTEEPEQPPPLILAIQIFAVLLTLASIATLRSNFSVLPEYRNLVAHGPYLAVRHPLYAAYLIFDGAVAFQAHSAEAAALWLAGALLFYARARFEERLLTRANPAYTDYCRRVQYLFVPYLV